jgi:hypothetical protein
MHRADHATPLYLQKLVLNFANKWRSLSRCSSLADWGPRSLFVFLFCHRHYTLPLNNKHRKKNDCQYTCWWYRKLSGCGYCHKFWKQPVAAISEQKLCILFILICWICPQSFIWLLCLNCCHTNNISVAVTSVIYIYIYINIATVVH